MKNEQVELLRKLTKEASLGTIQAYLESCFSLRGFDGQGVKEKMLLLLEEVGELAKAIRKEDASSSIDYTRIASYDSVESEVADVFIVLVSLCNLLHIDLYDAFLEKEKVNVERNWSR
ncbi:MazG nucleotide pyrophosphohydrolase domain-containing protein [Olsenella sp. Marseille-P4559]|uniref:MazG nucleotide pyrophosphohydrolase domain-containing protein n=1 Tax=Olsenella sp. Marseille-P4559 TaxID=2364795 RepID=UPI001031B2E6|nr:MazG nucleotide pyrophosphohydrolase domain-containing protein [Olsenella sp. Marseille-P4559]